MHSANVCLTYRPTCLYYLCSYLCFQSWGHCSKWLAFFLLNRNSLYHFINICWRWWASVLLAFSQQVTSAVFTFSRVIQVIPVKECSDYSETAKHLQCHISHGCARRQSMLLRCGNSPNLATPPQGQDLSAVCHSHSLHLFSKQTREEKAFNTHHGVKEEEAFILIHIVF